MDLLKGFEAIISRGFEVSCSLRMVSLCYGVGHPPEIWFLLRELEIVSALLMHVRFEESTTTVAWEFWGDGTILVARIYNQSVDSSQPKLGSMICNHCYNNISAMEVCQGRGVDWAATPGRTSIVLKHSRH